MPAARRFLLLSAGGPLWTEELAMIGAIPLLGESVASSEPSRGEAALAVLLAASRDSGLVYLISQAAASLQRGKSEGLPHLAEQLDSYAAEMRSRGEEKQARDAERASGYVREWDEDYQAELRRDQAERRRLFKEELEPGLQRLSHRLLVCSGEAQLRGDKASSDAWIKLHVATKRLLEIKRLEHDEPSQAHQPYLILPEQQ
jgi:hypothetical protein